MARNRVELDNRTLQTALQETTTAATIRAAEGQKIFSPIAIFLDKHRNQSTGLSPHLQKALFNLSDDLAPVRSWDPPPQNMVAHRLQLQSLRADTIGGFGLSPLKEASRQNRLNSVGLIRLSL